jgi:acyl transferase domain-containing protein
MQPIAIVGLGCRFPRAPDPEAFWSLLWNGVDAIGEVPSDRWDRDAYYDPEPNRTGKMITPCGGFLDTIDGFDAAFFEMDVREARRVDPQQRLMLEVAWEALEHAGIVPGRLAGSLTGVFIGMRQTDYGRYLYGDPARIDGKNPDNTYPCIVANRLSYLLDLRGPSLAVDTACSSSLVSVHLACRSLAAGDVDLAIAGGVNLNLFPEESVSRSLAGMISPSGRCRAFDASADGYVIGEGCGAVVLKRLADALADRDPILAVVKGSAVQHNGLSYRLTAYNGQSQQSLLRAALRDAGVAGSAVGHVEANGSGSLLGDPIELKALRGVLGAPDRLPCWVGSVKTNIGHLEGASGIASLIKTVLALQHEGIPAHLHLRELNPADVLDGSGLAVAAERRPWPRGVQERIAGVSAFGLGGANAHMVLGEAPSWVEAARETMPRPLHVLTLSARSEAALADLARRHADHLLRHPDLRVEDVCHTANTGRTQHRHRLAVVAGSIEQLAAALASDRAAGVKVKAKRPKLAFVFSEGVESCAAMGRELCELEPAFRDAHERCAALFGTTRTAGPQAHLFCVEYALAALWRSWGIVPDATAGSGVGRWVADAVAGRIELSDAIGGCRRACDRPAVDGEALIAAGCTVFVEIGPAGPALAQAPLWLPGPAAGGGAYAALAETAAALYLQGAPLDWMAFDGDRGARRVHLPTYPFQRERYPLDAQSTLDGGAAGAPDDPLAALLQGLLAAPDPGPLTALWGAGPDLFRQHVRKLTGDQARDLLEKALVVSADKARRIDAQGHETMLRRRIDALGPEPAHEPLAAAIEQLWQRDEMLERYLAAQTAAHSTGRWAPDDVRAALLFVSERLRRKDLLLKAALQPDPQTAG